jgi:hypothetical protein
VVIGEVLQVDIETGVRTIPSADDLLRLMPSAGELFPHISGQAMTREQLLSRVTCFYQGFVEPTDTSERVITRTIWDASGSNSSSP